ncbi:hypothetical protein ASD16_09895 [Cellulomonas sp. Root485]|uniref:hypothetical protein n=1 Tax=Cellulomonas sp. Root485 TaxID=1736546 RepID=UPI0006FFE7E9|nr:hypothetical protein [Cellulomonas sp. Root485]KQY22914.1 hypothetical protein ASD16_09895 [Cellulomonas sp. Root485]
MATTLDASRLYSAADRHEPIPGSIVWAVAHPLGEVPSTAQDQRWVAVMGEVMGVLLDTPGWPHGQVWSSGELCREQAWARHVVGRRTGFEVHRIEVVTPALFRLATR